jgi:Na+/H+ antiporter NhaD/arsenite permease-like protein
MNHEPQHPPPLNITRLARTLRYPVLLLLLIVAGLLIFGPPEARAQEGVDPTQPAVSGQVVDNQGQPIVEAEIHAFAPGREEPLAQTASLENGAWGFVLPFIPEDELEIVIERAHFAEERLILDAEDLTKLATTGTLRTGEQVLSRVLTPAFWAATLIFIAVLLVIALERLHSTTAALLGISLVFIVSFIGGTFLPGLYIYSFERALTYINWEVIFLVMAMMIIIAIIEGTGVFQWTAFAAYRMSRGRSWVLVLILMAITAVASALLDNFTTMLLMTPISLQIGLAIGINPLALIIPEVLASNVGGISTLIGTPTNILIGAYADIGFNGFLVNQTPGVILALMAMGGYVLWHYRKEWRKSTGGISPRLYERLAENARIRQPDALRKASVVFVLVIIGFILGEQIHVPPAVPALIGATALLIWLKPDVHAMIKAVDWTTLVFFMALFMLVGAIQEVGLISLIANQIGAFVGDNLALAIFVMVFGVGTLSVVIANIPLAASMLPVVEFLSGTIPGANSKVLYYALSMGAAMGGNGTIVGAEANLVTAGITQQAGTPISFAEFLKVGLPVTFITLTIGFIWLYVWFILF